MNLHTTTSAIAQRLPPIPILARLLPMFVLLVGLLLSGCDRGKVEKLEAENTELKGELKKVQDQVKELAAKQKQEVAAQAQEEAKKKQELAEKEEKEKQEQVAKKAQAINKCFDRMRLQMKSLLDEPRDFAFKNKSERSAIESRLKTLANSKKSEIGEIIIELKGLEFPATSDLDFIVSSFIRNYTSMVFSERVSYDYIEMGSDNYKEHSGESRKSMSLAYADMRKVDDVKRNIGKEKSGDKNNGNGISPETETSKVLAAHTFNSNGFCEKCGWERDYLVSNGKTECNPKKN